MVWWPALSPSLRVYVGNDHRSLCAGFQNDGFKFDRDAADRPRGLLTSVLYSWTWYFCIFNSKSSNKITKYITKLLSLCFCFLLNVTHNQLHVFNIRTTFSRLMTYIYIYIYMCVCVCRTAPLTSRCCILYIYSTNIRTEYFKHTANSPFFPLQNAFYFIMLPFLVSVLFTF